MRIEVPDSEVVDRITILELKVARLSDPAKRARAAENLASLRADWAGAARGPLDALDALPRLRAVNAALWDVEEELRAAEREQRFDARFIELARSVYRLNDERARLKAAIDAQTGSTLREPKSYA